MLENTETVHGTSITNEIKVEDKIAIAGSLSLEEQSKKRWDNVKILTDQIIDLSNNYGFDAGCCLNLTMTCCNKEYYQEIIDTENGRLQRVKNDGLSVETGLQS